MDAASETEGLEAPAAPAAIARGRPGRSLDARLVRRLLGILGNPADRIPAGLDRRAHRRPAAHGSAIHVRIADRTTLLGLLRNPRMRFGDPTAPAALRSKAI